MATAGESYLEQVEHASKVGRLVSQDKFIEQLMNPRFADHRERVFKAVKEQSRLARSRKDMKWLKKVANTADSLQMIDRTWINTNIYDIGSVKSKPSAMPHEGSYRDMRLGVEEGIESRVDNAITGTPMEIECPTSNNDILSLTRPIDAEDSLLGKEERTHKSPSSPKPTLAAMPLPIQVPTGSASSDAAKSGKSRHHKHQSRAERHEQTERRSDNPPYY